VYIRLIEGGEEFVVEIKEEIKEIEKQM